ncbi:MAG: RDD family protein [Candidatus Korobacteraceae bacterium]|jgi:uncharacterized RDD family membrane protein YckC
MTEQQTLPSDPSADSSQLPDDLRTEIQSRVEGYRHRRGRRVVGAFSMRFPFPPTEVEESPQDPEKEIGEVGEVVLVAEQVRCVAAAAVAEPGETIDSVPESTPNAAVASEEPRSRTEADIQVPEADSCLPAIEAEPDPMLALAPVPRPRGKRKVIAFPRPASAAEETFHRLADPVVPEQLRILDVPEELEAFPTARLLDGLQSLSSTQQAVTPTDHIELPFQAVSLSQRLYAGLIDCAIVAAGAVVFGAVTYKMLPKPSATKPVLMAAAGVLILLWAVYQYVFTLYGGATPGMRMLRMRLRTFKGGNLCWRHRRSRVIGLYFSTASLMMGLFWALVDVDTLCWHDRISRTYLTTRE